MNVHTYLLVSLFLLTPHLLKSASQKPAHYLKRDSKKKGPRITTPVVLQKLALSGYCDDSDTLQLQDALLMNKERRLSWLQHHATGGNASAAYLLAKNYLEKEDKPALAWKCFSSHLALAQKNYHRRLLLGDARLYPCYSRYDFCRKERNLRQQCWERMPDDKKEEFITSPDESIRQQRWLHFANGAPFPPEQCTAIKGPFNNEADH